MKALQVTHFATSGNIQWTEDAAKPAIVKPTQLLVKVSAASLNPADIGIMTGGISLVFRASNCPYIPGLDLCGIVEEVGEKCKEFKKGDRVAAVLDKIEEGAFAEYAVFESSQAAHVPESLSDLEAAALPTVGCTAFSTINAANITEGARVMVLGGSGGIGSLVVQLCKAKGASFIASTSTNTDLVKSLGADLVINYNEQTWWEMDDVKELDLILDCIGSQDAWTHCDEVLKSSGRYIAVADDPNTKLRGITEMLTFVSRLAWRSWNPFTTSYKLICSFPTGSDVEAMFTSFQDTAHAVLDPTSPYTFTQASMEAAVQLQASHHAKGKIVMQME